MVKVIKIAKFSPKVKKLFKKLNISNSTARMLQSLTLALFCVHVVACFWFISAKFDNFSPDTWVFRRGIMEKHMIY